MMSRNQVTIVRIATAGPAALVPKTPPTANPMPASAAANSPSTSVPTTGGDVAAGDARADRDPDRREP